MTSRYAEAVHAAAAGNPIVVALGGGADSAMLLWAAVEAGNGPPVRAVFAYHGLESSPLLERSARALVAALGVDLVVLDAVIPDGPDLEARSRAARYRAIEAEITPDEVVLTGHTADDQAETVLMRVLRGSGATGLAGIPDHRGPWRRPFLAFTRSELRREAEQRSLPFADDPANTDGRFLRSRIRHGLLPEIEADYAPGIVTSLLRTARMARADDELIEAMAERIPISVVAGHVAIPAPALASAQIPVASRAVRRALRRCGDSYPGSEGDVSSVLEVAASGTSVVIGGGIHVRYESPMVVFDTGGGPECDGARQVAGASFTWAGDTYSVTRSQHPAAVRTAGRFSVFAAPKKEGALGVRSLGEGDRLEIGTGSTPVTEVLRDHGVPAILRPCWLLITIGGKIAVVHGVRTAAWAAPRNGDEIIIIEREVHS